jgi:pSer/pThr/pTyr-binding forkhead associated (FHA) protein
MATTQFQLTMRSGPTPGETYPLTTDEILLGRDLANDIPIGQPEVSRRHARFYWDQGNIYIEDLGSTNGTFINGSRISSPQQLRSGDAVTVGENVVLVFEKVALGVEEQYAHISPQKEEFTPVSQPIPEPEVYQPTPEPYSYIASQGADETVMEEAEPAPVERKKERGLPSWLIILMVAIVVLIFVIAVTLWFMPASWWCAITFDMLEGCPLP